MAPRKNALSPFGEAVERRARELGVPRSAIARQMSVDPSTLYRWMLQPPTDVRMALLARAGGIAPASPASQASLSCEQVAARVRAMARGLSERGDDRVALALYRLADEIDPIVTAALATAAHLVGL